MPRRSKRNKKRVVNVADTAQVTLQDAYKLPEYRKRYQKTDDDYIVVLDSDDFKTHPTGYDTWAAATQIIRNQYQTWYNALKSELNLSNKPNITWLIKHWPRVRKLIDDRVRSGKYKPNTKRIHQDALSHMLLFIDKKKYRELTRPWWLDSINISKKYEVERQDNELTADQQLNFVCYPELVRQRDILYDEWQANPKNKKLNMYHLILAMNTYIPPLRLNVNHMHVWRQRKPPPKDNINYLWERQAGLWARVIQNDKIEGSRQKSAAKFGKVAEREIFDVEEALPKLPGAGKKLNQIITQSFEVFPRNYVLTAVRSEAGRPMGDSSYASALKNMFKPRKPTQTLLRKAFVTYFHQLPGMTYNNKNKIASRMRHTTQVAEKSYFKVNAPCEETDGMVDDTPVPKVQPQVLKPVPKPKPRVLKDPRVSAKAYRDKNKDKIQAYRKANRYKINKTKLLWSLNKQAIKYPRQTTLDKYGIVYSDALKRYIVKN